MSAAAGFAFAFSEAELVIARSAFNVLIDAYKVMAEKEVNAVDRADLNDYARAGSELLARFRRLDGDVSAPLSPGDLSVLERSLRMSMAKWQTMIRPTMSAEQKKLHRDSADDVGELFTKLRKARGLPW